MRKIISIVVLSIALTACNKEKKVVFEKQKNETNYIKIGKEIALATKKQLGKNLKQAIAKSGTIGALSFCNEKAMPLTHEMEVKYKANIKRVSDKNRNPINTANATELKHIETFKKALSKGEQLKPIVEKTNGEIKFYAPIKTNGLCLQCHGKPTKKIANKIAKLYPKDLATGYNINEIRGIWSITFKE